MHGRGNQGGGLGFGPPFTPPIIKNLLIANGIVFVIQLAIPSFTDLFGVVPLLGKGTKKGWHRACWPLFFVLLL